MNTLLLIVFNIMIQQNLAIEASITAFIVVLTAHQSRDYAKRAVPAKLIFCRVNQDEHAPRILFKA